MIDFFNLSIQQRSISDQIQRNISKVLSHGKYILGPEVEELEDHLIKYTGARHCITCANGTDALQIALMALDVGPGDEVIIPAFSYIATAEAAKLLGAKVVYVDVDEMTYNIDPASLKNKISNRTKAILPVSLYGQPADFSVINSAVEGTDIKVIEDAAQSFGATYQKQKSCNLSHIGCTSFFPTKPLGCYGDGGAVFTSDPALASKMRMIARHGQAKRYEHVTVGINSRLDTLQAAILLAKLGILDVEIKKKQKLADNYNREFSNLKEIIAPKVQKFRSSAWAQYTIITQKRDELRTFLNNRGIPTAVHYPKPLNKQKAVESLEEEFPVSEKLASSVLSLPMNAYVTDDEFDHITSSIKAFF